MSDFASANLTAGQLNALVKKVGGEERVLRVLRDELVLVVKEEIKEVSNINLAKVYDHCGLTQEYEEAQKGFDLTEDPNLWKLLMVKGLTMEKVISAYQKAGVELETFDVDLQKVINPEREQRNPNRDGTYLAGFRRKVEADEENRNQPADQREKQGCQDITLMERLVIGLAYFLATGKHLDIKNWTLCAGSRHRNGNVPRVDFDPARGKVHVSWSSPGHHYDDLRARSVSVLPAKPREAVA